MSDAKTPRDEPEPTTKTLLAIARGRSLHPVLFVAVLGALGTLGPFTMDLYLPAFPLLAADFDTSAGAIQLTLTATAVGLGVGQLLVGPLSDATGRRVPLLSSIALHVICTIAVATAPTIELMTLARFGQGIGAAAGAVVSAAMVRDVFGGRRLVRIAARIALINGLAPVIAPVIGSQLMLVTSWRGVFALLAAFGFATLIAAAIVLPETHPRARRLQTRSSVGTRIAILLRDRVYVGTVFISSMVFAMIVTFLSASPFLFQDVLGLSEQEFGLMFAVKAIGLLIATQGSARLMQRFQPATLLCVVFPLIALVGGLLVVVGWLEAGLAWAVIPSFLVVACQGFCNPCTQVLLVAEHSAESGTAVALNGFVCSVLGGGMSLVPAALGGVTFVTLGLVVAAAGVIGVIVLLTVVRPWSVPPLSRA